MLLYVGYRIETVERKGNEIKGKKKKKNTQARRREKERLKILRVHIYRAKSRGEKEKALTRLFACPRRRGSERLRQEQSLSSSAGRRQKVRDRKRGKEREVKKNPATEARRDTRSQGKRRKMEGERRRGREKERGGHNRADRVIIRDEKHLTSAPGW